jgi:heme-degrading monooxygenase HmoA
LGTSDAQRKRRRHSACPDSTVSVFALLWLRGLCARLLQVSSYGVENVDRSVGERGDGGVFARITKFEGSPERLDELRHAVVERTLPAVRRLDGFAGAVVLGDRQSGNVQVVVLWESEEAMDASEESAYWFRTYSAEAADERITGVERYEVVFSEIVNGTQP